MKKKPDYTAWYLKDRATGEEYYYLQQPNSVIRVNLTRLYINGANVEHLVNGLFDPGELEPVTIQRYRQIVRTVYVRAIKHDIFSVNPFQLMLKRETIKNDGPKTYLVTTWYLLGLLPVYRTELLRQY